MIIRLWFKVIGVIITDFIRCHRFVSVGLGTEDIRKLIFSVPQCENKKTFNRKLPKPLKGGSTD